VAFSPDGRLLAAGSGHGDARVILWDVTDPAQPARTATLTVGRRWRAPSAYAVGFSPDGRLLATGSSDGTAILWDVTDPTKGARTATFVLHPRRRWLGSPDSTVHALGFSPNGRLLAISSQRRGVTGDVMVASGPSVSEVSLWDVTDPAQPAPTATLTHRRVSNKQRWADRLDDEPTVYAVGFSVDGSLLATGSADGTVGLWDVTDPTQPAWTASLTHHLGVRAAGFSPDGRLLAACGDNSVTLWRRSP
jgi:WD40 repeat protein